MSTAKRVAVALTFAVLAARVAHATAPQDPFRALAPRLEQIRVDSKVTGMAVAVASHGKIVFLKGFGWANREKRVPATGDTMFSLASVSKPMTATGVMTLAQAGRLGLDRPINDYLGEAQLQARIGDAAQATVRRVANHSAGLPWHYEYHFDHAPYPVPSLLETLQHYGNLVTIPGEHYRYSNLGYAALGYLTARVSGVDFGTYMREQVFLKLGMRHSSVGIGHGLERYAAMRYDVDGALLANYQPDSPGAGGLYSSARDVIRFAMFHLKDHLPDQQAILSDASIDEMHQPTMKAEEDPPTGYGMGWVVLEHPAGYHVVTHSGGMLGVATDLILLPDEDLAVVVLTNGNGKGVAAAEDLLIQALLPRWRGMAEPAERDPPPFTPPTELLGAWVGVVHTYLGDRPAMLKVLADGQVLLNLGNEAASAVDRTLWTDGILQGIARGELNTPDVQRHQPYKLELHLQIRDARLTGSITAVGVEGVNSARPFALTHWADLTKAAP